MRDFPCPDPLHDELYARELRRAINRTRGFLAERQHPEGYWIAEPEGDALLQSETIMLLAFLGEEGGELAEFCANDLIETQLSDGGWGVPAGARADLHRSVKAYFALKLTGHDPGAEFMQLARKTIFRLGGPEKTDCFTRFYLALLGQIPYDQAPAVPPQMLFPPKWFPVAPHTRIAWLRTIFAPISIVSALRPVRDVSPERGIRELFTHDPKTWPKIVASLRGETGTMFSRDRFFRFLGKGLRKCRELGFAPFRNDSLGKAKTWLLERFEGGNGFGAIHPQIVWSWIALKALGYADDAWETLRCREQLGDLVSWDRDNRRARLKLCESSVRDTSLTLKTLMTGGMTTAHPMIRKGVRWIRSRQSTREDRKSDGARTVTVEPGGWSFGFNDEFYPDNDDTAMCLMVLRGCFPESSGTNGGAEYPRLLAGRSVATIKDAKSETLEIADVFRAIDYGVNRLFAMQNSDGGWAAFEKDDTGAPPCRIPLVDHDVLIDPSSPDVSARVLESLGGFGYKAGKDERIARCVKYLRERQKPDGSWFARRDADSLRGSLYGTWQVLTGLTAVGVPTDDPMIVAGKNWLLACRRPCGGWGEDSHTSADSRVHGPGMPGVSQTAWAVMGLIAAGSGDHPAVYRGIRFLLDRQNEDGTWNSEPEFPGVGVPSTFYSRYDCLRHDYGRIDFPLMALSLYAREAKLANPGVLEVEAAQSPDISETTTGNERNATVSKDTLPREQTPVLFPISNYVLPIRHMRPERHARAVDSFVRGCFGQRNSVQNGSVQGDRESEPVFPPGWKVVRCDENHETAPHRSVVPPPHLRVFYG